GPREVQGRLDPPHHHGSPAPSTQHRVSTAVAREDFQATRRAHDGAETTWRRIRVGRQGRPQPHLADLHHEGARDEPAQVFTPQGSYEVAEAIDGEDLAPDVITPAQGHGEDETYRIRDGASETLQSNARGEMTRGGSEKITAVEGSAER